MIYKIYYVYKEMASVEVEANSMAEADEKFWELDIIAGSEEIVPMGVDAEEEIYRIEAVPNTPEVVSNSNI